MNKKIFRYSLMISLLLLLVSVVLIMGILYDYFQNQLKSELKKEADYIGAAVLTEGISYFDKINSDERITLIAPDGNVLADTDADSEKLENHLDRKEIQLALKDGSGTSVRYSKTFMERTVYYAVKLENGNILRVSAKQYTVISILIGLSQPIAVIILLTVLASAILTAKISKNVIDNEEQKKREIMRREFTSNVSHELKTPLTSISGFAEMLMQGDADSATVADFSRSIYDESQRMITLVQDILRISELDEKTEFEQENIDLYDLAEEITERLQPQAEKAQVQLRVIGEHCHVNGVQKILDEIIYNLCDNAIKYNRPNGLAEISIHESENTVKLSVRDTGIGIAKEEQERIFERFYRVDKARSKAIGGTGLGLSIVKHGAIYHHAQIQIDSDIGKGTTVTVCFPVAEKK